MWFPSNNDSSVVATIRLPLLAFIVLGLSNLHAATFNWNGSANDNWDNGSNWGGGNPGYPGRDRDTDTAELYGDFSNNSSRFTIDMNNGTNGRITKISNLYVTADSSSDNWDLIDTNGHSATIEISGKMAFDLDSSGTFNCEAYLTVSGSDLYVAADSGSRPVFERSISGSGILDATDGILVENKTLYGGTVAFTAAYNDSFTGRIKTGITKIETTSTEGFRNATIEISNNPNSFIFPNGAKIKALTGNYNLALEGKQLRVEL